MSKIKTLFCLVVITGLISSISVSANIDKTNNVVTIQYEPYLDGYRCLSIVGPNYDPFTEILFTGKWESYAGTYNRTGPISPIIDRFDSTTYMDALCDEITITDFDLIWLPGEYHDMNNSLSYYPTAISLIIDAYNAGLVIVAVNHGVQILATADIVTGKNITSVPFIQSEMEAAGANFINSDFGIQTDFPFVTCIGYDEPFLIYAAAAALGVLIIPLPPLPLPPPSPTPPAAIPIPSLIFIMCVSLLAFIYKKKRR